MLERTAANHPGHFSLTFGDQQRKGPVTKKSPCTFMEVASE